MKKFLLFGLLLTLVLSSCAKKKVQRQAEKDDKIIQEYLQSHGLTATKTESGLYYIIEVEGAGPACNSNSDVRVAYDGYYPDGGGFDASNAQGVTFNLQQVIQGWTEGIPYFKEGGSGKLLIPSALGYGPNGSASIPENAVLIFDITLLEVL